MTGGETREEWAAYGRAMRARDDALRAAGQWRAKQRPRRAVPVVDANAAAAIVSLTGFHGSTPVRRLLSGGGPRWVNMARAAAASLLAERLDAGTAGIARHLRVSSQTARQLARRGAALRAAGGAIARLTDRVAADLDAEAAA